VHKEFFSARSYALSCSLLYSARSKLRPNIRFTFRCVLVVFTHSAITPPKVNRFGWHLEHSEYIVRSSPWHILGAIRAVATAGLLESQANFLSCKQRTISSIYRGPNFTKFEHNTSIAITMKTFGREFWKFYRKGSFLRIMQKMSKNFNVLRLQAAITPQLLQNAERQFTTKIAIYGISGFCFCHWNQFKIIPLAYTLRTRNLLKFSATTRQITLTSRSRRQPITGDAYSVA